MQYKQIAQSLAEIVNGKDGLYLFSDVKKMMHTWEKILGIKVNSNHVFHFDEKNKSISYKRNTLDLVLKKDLKRIRGKEYGFAIIDESI